MTPTFLIVAAGAVILAVLFVLLPLLRSSNPEQARVQRQIEALDDLIDELDPADYAKQRKALRARLDGMGGQRKVGLGLIAVLALIVPIGTIFFYNTVGEPDGLTPVNAPVTQLRNELIGISNSIARNPDDPEQWTRMAVAYKNMQEFGAAAHAFRRALYVDDRNPFVKVELAETLMFMGRPSGPASEVQQLLTDALSVDENHQKAMWLMGISASQAGNHGLAIAWWEQLLPQLDPGSSVYNSIRGQIAQARMELGQDPGEIPTPRSAPPLRPGQDTLPPGHPPMEGQEQRQPRMAGPLTPGAQPPPDHPTSGSPQPRPGPVDPDAALPPGHPPMQAQAPEPQPEPPAVAETAPSFRVEVDIEPELVNGLSGSETVFVVARAASGPPTPLAVRRMTVADLPARFGLSDNDAMVEGMNLSAFPEIIVVARVSMTGDVSPQSGDLQGSSGAVSILDEPGTRITISERL